jgi:pSer/pThr/pTyr-binding forkhead associated (FHA) protein
MTPSTLPVARIGKRIPPREDIELIRSCHWELLDSRVSKCHFRIYTVLFDQNNCNIQPMVYCEDLESLNGTYVNDSLIGKLNYRRPPCLLSDGDVIAIKPNWKFHFRQPGTSPCPQERGRNKDSEVDRRNPISSSTDRK